VEKGEQTIKEVLNNEEDEQEVALELKEITGEESPGKTGGKKEGEHDLLSKGPG